MGSCVIMMYLWLSSRSSAFLRYPWVPQGSSEICQWAPSPKISNVFVIREQFSDLNAAKAFNWCLQYSGFEGLLQFFIVRLGFSCGKVLHTRALCWLLTPLSEFDDNSAAAFAHVFWKPCTTWSWSIPDLKEEPKQCSRNQRRAAGIEEKRPFCIWD